MKLWTLCAIIAAFTVLALASTPTKSLRSMGWPVHIGNDAYQLNFVVSSKKDLLVHYDAGNVISVRRRNAEGVYVPVVNVTEAVSTTPRTNGKWIAASVQGAFLFSLDQNNVLSQKSYIPTLGGFVLSDDTFVGYDQISPLNDGNYVFRTYQYFASNNTWAPIPGTELVTRSGVQVNGDMSTYLVTDTHLVYLDMSDNMNLTVKIHKRQANKSWKLVDFLPVNVTEFNQSPNLAFNGVDTIVYTSAKYPNSLTLVYGVAVIYTKVNGKWTQQTFTAASRQMKPQAYFGVTVEFSDPNTLFISAGQDGFAGFGYIGGRILMFTRNADGLWEHSLDLVADTGLFGMGFAINDHDIVVVNYFSNGPSAYQEIYYAPICFTQPINASCMDQQASDCSELDFTKLYTANNPECGTVTASIGSVSLINNQAVRAHLTLTRGYGADYTCNVTVTCPAPPVAPVTVQTPVSVQAPTARVSGAGVIQRAIASLFVSAAMLMSM